jgi:hypothetical protein
MNASFKHAAAITTAIGVLGIVAGGCLNRDVVSRDPSTNTTFTTSVHSQTIDKVDLLFMIDNSPSMGDKQTLLALAVPNMIARLATPNCVNVMTGAVMGTIDASGNCPSGFKPEFNAVHDMHIGIVSSSLGSRGGDVCPDNTMNPVNASISAHDNDNGELINRGGVAGNPGMETSPGTTDAPSPLNFLSYFPSVAANMGKPTPPTPPVTSANQLVSDFTTLISGVHEHGCGFEAQNEAWYRFLVQPDPFQSINKNGNQAVLTGIDNTILQQRAAFLRPDSLLAVIVVTDENEEAADPLSIAGQGWAFDQSSFPGSQSGGGAPQGTVECGKLDPNNPTMTGPNDPNCTSCAFNNLGSNTTRCPKDGANGNAGYLDPQNDAINLRFWQQKRRFGLFAGYPTSRYVRGLQKTTVPSVGLAFMGDKDHEHDGNGNYIGDQDANANCVNPIYAQNLPTSASMDLCHLTAGPRTPDLVYYAAIAGVPHQLLQAKPGATDSSNVDPTTMKPVCPAGTPQAQCPQKDTLSDADWKLILGTDPEHYDFRGQDFHMVESDTPRTTNTGGWANAATSTNQAGCQLDQNGNAPAGCDPINGAEFNPNKEDLEFACTFPLVQVQGGQITSFQKDCTNAMFNQACDCQSTSLDKGTQLCSATTATTQVNAKAYPSVREMIIAHAMSTELINGQVSNQGIVSSLCPINLDVGMSQTAANADPLFGYNPAVNAIINRLKASLSNTCIPQKLNPNTDGTVSCLILVTLPPGTGGGTCKNPGKACTGALIGPGGNLATGQGVTSSAPFLQSVLDKFCDDQESTYTGSGGKPGGMNDPANMPVCALQQVVITAADDQSCSGSSTPGWCYVQGQGAVALNCPEGTIVFTSSEPPNGATTSLQCLETSISVTGDAGGGGSSGGGGGG